LDPWGEKELNLHSTTSQPKVARWLTLNGPKELEQLFRAIVYHPSAPILIADDGGTCQDASVGASKLLGLPRAQIIGRQLTEFAQPRFKPQVSELLSALQGQGEQQGTLGLKGPNARSRDVRYTAKANVLPLRHVLALLEETSPETTKHSSVGMIPSWVQDYALYLVDSEGNVAAWYGGAERIYGYVCDEVIGQHVSLLYPGEKSLRSKLQEHFNRAERQGYVGNEEWSLRKDGSRFWASVIMTALKDESGNLQGFAVAARDFSDRHKRDETLRRARGSSRPVRAESTIAGIVSGEFDCIPEANDAFLELVGYSREDLEEGRLQWPDLTPPEYFALDELAHEEELRFGACTPFEKELIRKDGTRVPVMVATAVLKLAPFRWITFVQDMRERDRIEAIDEKPAETNPHFEEIAGSSALLKRMMSQVELVAPTDATVLILGETGTGKELVARAIHKISPRKNFPFVTLNCAAIPTGLLESELFGYERGAFTGALSQKIGRFEMAHKGTLFLDEVGDIPIDLQPKLLRALQEKSFERLGGTRTIPIDVRLLAATNRNLNQMMDEKLFRSDLYYRLKVFPITTPALRDRPEDIPILVRHFTKKYSAKMERQIEKIPTDTMDALVSWRWPGNVRELENFIERSVILSKGPSLRAPLEEIREDALGSSGDATLEQVERDHIMRVLRQSGGVVTAAATRLGLHRTTLNAMMRRLGVFRKDI
jgi:PAS domain S-box-containing protein